MFVWWFANNLCGRAVFQIKIVYSRWSANHVRAYHAKVCNARAKKRLQSVSNLNNNLEIVDNITYTNINAMGAVSISVVNGKLRNGMQTDYSGGTDRSPQY